MMETTKEEKGTSGAVFCRWSPSLGSLEDTAERVWGTPEYEGDRDAPTVFFGIYGLPDFYALWRHRGKRWILWAGSDIKHLKDGYWLEDGGGIRLHTPPLAAWIEQHCDSWVENEVERKALAEMGIHAHVCPSFLGDVKQFDVSYQPSERPALYTSVSGDNFALYGWHRIPELAAKHPEVDFHLYGSTSPFFASAPNIIDHGRVPKEQMNREIAQMQGALRLTEFDGFSEILAKSVLMGQWPVSLIKYPHILSVEDIGKFAGKREPNYAGRHHYISVLNKYPWIKK